jgi:zinc protease
VISLQRTSRHLSRQLEILLVVLLGIGAPRGLGAQGRPPGALPESGTRLPRIESRTLGIGADLVVVERAEMPYVTVSVTVRDVVPVGSGTPGLAAVVARLLTAGTTTRTADELARAIDRLGATLDARAGPDGAIITLGVARADLSAGLEILADVVMRPSFEAAALARLLDGLTGEADASGAQPPTMATRALLRRMYGQHRYGRGAGEEQVGELDSETLGAYHAANYSPGNATFVASGGVTLDEFAEGIEEHFGTWTGSLGTAPPGVKPPEPEANEVVLVHVPGAVRATIRVGHLLPVGSDPDWVALEVANLVLRERLGRVSSTVNRRVEEGYFVAGAEVPAEAVDGTVGFILDEMERLRFEEVLPAELDPIKGFLAGSFLLQVETPQQIVARVARDRLLGVFSERLDEYPNRVRGLDGATLRGAALRRIRPQVAVIAVVGDASVLRGPLTKFGPVTVIDAEGRTLGLADLAMSQEPMALELDASGLEEGSWVYGLTLDGERVGEMVRTLDRSDPADPDAITLTSTMVTGPQTLRQEVTFRASTFAPVAASFSLVAPGGEIGAGATVEDGLVQGSRTYPDGRVEEFQAPASAGAVMGEMLELALWLIDHAPGRTIRIPVTQVESGATTIMSAQVLDETTVEVPAGTFQAYRIEMVSDAGEQILYARAEAPHIVLRLETRGQPLVMQLEFISAF